MAKYNIYGIGAALVDTEIEVTDTDLQTLNVEKGLMTLVDEDRQHELVRGLEGHMVHSRRASGGSACNSIFAASVFGSKAYYSCKVADDDNGSFFIGDLKAAGVDTNENNRLDGITGKCLVLITPDAERSMNTFLGISETLSAMDVNAEAIADSDYMYMEGYLVTSETGRAAAVKAREVAEANGVKTSISLSDPGMVQFFKDGLKEMIGGGVDLLFCNEDEAKGWAETDDLDTAIAELKKIAKSFAITLGAKGAVIFDGGELVAVDAQPVKAVDTNGAGDMFAGAYLYAIGQSWDVKKAGEFACTAAGKVVADFGPRLSIEGHKALLA